MKNKIAMKKNRKKEKMRKCNETKEKTKTWLKSNGQKIGRM